MNKDLTEVYRNFNMMVEELNKIQYMNKDFMNKFYQADTSHANKGLGLGLAIAKRIIYLHDGVIEVNSEYGVGTEFKIKLPLSD